MVVCVLKRTDWKKPGAECKYLVRKGGCVWEVRGGERKGGGKK